MVTLARLLQSEKAPISMLVTLSGIVMLVRPLPRKVYSPMLGTLFPMVTLARLVQLLKAQSPMLVTLFPMVTLVRLVQPKKALFSIPVTLFGMVKVPIFPAGYITKVVLSLLYNTPLSELNTVLAVSTFIAARLVRYAGKVVATGKSAFPNSGNAVRYDHAGKPPATIKSVRSNAGNAAGYGYAGKVGATIKSIRSNAGNAVG